jgi:hypothetical protein
VYQPGFSSTLRRITLGVSGAVVAHADEAPEDLVLRRDVAQAGQRLVLVDGGRSASGSRNRIEAGTIASTIESSESWPMAASIAPISSSPGPMWRATNSSWPSSVVSGTCGSRSFIEDPRSITIVAPAQAGARVQLAEPQIGSRPSPG